MTEHIDINRSRLEAVLGQMRNEGITSVLTTEIIEKYMSGFHSNRGVPGSISWNAQFGKYLKENASSLQIAEAKAKVRVKVRDGETHASRWSLSDGHQAS